MNNNLSQYSRIITSQCGEDGIIEEIFKRIGAVNRVCVEFGAWDGKTLSNTWELWHNRGWSALLIESDINKFKELQDNTKEFSKVTAFNAVIRHCGPDSLDNVLSKFSLPVNLDLISIDIDGDDYYIFESLNNFRPRVIAIEYNSTIPPELEIIQNSGQHLGASALALIKLAARKGYKFAYCTKTTCFFVSNEEFHKLGIDEPSLRDIFPIEDLRYVIISYDSHTFMNKDLWSFMPLKSITSPRSVLFSFLKGLKQSITHKKTEAGKNLIPVAIFRRDKQVRKRG